MINTKCKPTKGGYVERTYQKSNNHVACNKMPLKKAHASGHLKIVKAARIVADKAVAANDLEGLLS